MWILLPFTVGDALIDAVADQPAALRAVLTWGNFGLWAIGAVALFVPAPLSLTVVRVLGPLALTTGAWTAWQAPTSIASIAGVVVGTLCAVLTCGGEVADDFVNAASYGEERRFSLRAPGMVVLIGAPLAWCVLVAGLWAGPLLLAQQRWLPGAALTAVGLPVGFLAFRSLHALSARFVVFVPAGMTLVDGLALVDAVLVPRGQVRSFRAAPVEGERTDLSSHARGLALQIDVNEPLALTLRRGPRRAEQIETTAVVFTPARPASVLEEARRRRFPGA